MRDLTRQLEARLPRHVKTGAEAKPRAGRAAVAIMLREGEQATEMLMIRRATREAIHGPGIWGFRVGGVTQMMRVIFPVRSGKLRKNWVWIWLGLAKHWASCLT